MSNKDYLGDPINFLNPTERLEYALAQLDSAISFVNACMEDVRQAREARDYAEQEAVTGQDYKEEHNDYGAATHGE